jgi:acyl-CoA thioesterase
MSFYEPLGEGRFASTPHTRGPWDPAFQHAGPPAALLGRALERCEPREGFVLARATFEIVRAVPVAEVRVAARVARPGRSVELLEGELTVEDEPVMLVRAWRVKATSAPDVHRDDPPPPRPEETSPLPPEMAEFGYGHAVELRFVAGGWWQHRPATVWTRMRVPLVAGEEPTGVQRVLVVADSGNGVSAVLPFHRWLFINTELTVHFRRPARGEWICLDAETSIASDGAGLARSVLSDDEGVVAQGAQALLVAPRGA